MLRQKFTVQVTTLPDCDDITRFDGMSIRGRLKNSTTKVKQISYSFMHFACFKRDLCAKWRSKKSMTPPTHRGCTVNVLVPLRTKILHHAPLLSTA